METLINIILNNTVKLIIPDTNALYTLCYSDDIKSAVDYSTTLLTLTVKVCLAEFLYILAMTQGVEGTAL